uniref:Uncharacterized protein n=1 Tax=uncultured marine thaumarchaeote SAT1000_05_G10 TaxID=1456358 RepID=A0A075I1H2_9ARCH|nr:hypothetical protein [uncultured marine thaumarchaeote SAT1000_05_G10]
MIIPLAYVITPNKYEAKILSGISNTKKSAKKSKQWVPNV